MLSYENCNLCPRHCGVNRKSGERGYCKMPAQAVAAKAMVHYGEEPLISGSFGTGAVFFSGCTMGCIYCQNMEISKYGKGKPVNAAELRQTFERLIEEGVQSIDLVTPTHFLPDILPALAPKLPVPVVYNCGGYESTETLRALDGLVDIYLPDFKYSDNKLAARLSFAPDYFEVAAAAIKEMYRQTGAARIQDGVMERGVLIRHLVLPGHLNNTLGVLEWISENFPENTVPISLMSQYVPNPSLAAPLDRHLTEEEYAGALSWAELCGLKFGYAQDSTAATNEYLPDFDFSGL